MKVSNFDELMQGLEGLYKELFSHPVYNEIRDVEGLQIFMESHAFAVWDFMSLLKSLQQKLTSVTVPWIPPRNIRAARLVNEIVLCEESDEVSPGHFRGHFDLYIESMGEVEANGRIVLEFIEHLENGLGVEEALSRVPVLEATKNFVLTNIDIATHGKVHEVAAAFLFGREDVIPRMFERLVENLELGHGEDFKSFNLYLKRHIEVDAGEHSGMGKKIIQDLCGRDAAKWNEAYECAERSIKARMNLWTGVLNELKLHGLTLEQNAVEVA